MTAASGEVLTSKEDALKKIMPAAEAVEYKTITLTAAQMEKLASQARIELDTPGEDSYSYYVGKVNGQVSGYAFEDTVHGKWGPIHYLAGITPAGRISDIVVLEYKEIRGRPIAKKRFLHQFFGKTIQDPKYREHMVGQIIGQLVEGIMK